MHAQYEQHMISSGDNFPQISLNDNDRNKFLAGLHNGFSIGQIQKSLHWSDSLLQQELNLLAENSYIRQVGESFHPSVNIIMQNEASDIFEHTDPIAELLTRSLIELEPDLKTFYERTAVSNTYGYSELSFFLLSDVLLDNWQINNVEDQFLQKERPLRHGKRYYLQIAEKDTLNSREVFGIYGNQYACNDSICFITYGNNRKNQVKSTEELSQMELPFLSIQDQSVLSDMADFYLPHLLKVLNENRAGFEAFYESSAFKAETDFEEFFIWYYHFLYTNVTNKLHERGIIRIPENGVFRVKIER